MGKLSIPSSAAKMLHELRQALVGAARTSTNNLLAKAWPVQRGMACVRSVDFYHGYLCTSWRHADA